MNVVIVGKRDGKRVIRWPQLMGLSVVLAAVFGLGVGFVYSLLVGQWEPWPVLFGIGMGVSLTGAGLLNGLRCPLEKLTPCD